MPALRDLQRLFWSALVRPHDQVARAGFDPNLVGCVVAHGALDAAGRIDVYARMYCARLIEALADDFPRVLAAVGTEQFDTLAHDYVERHPSRHPSIRFVGEDFAAFLANRGGGCHTPPWLPDLARLEWARRDVFDDADVRPLTRADLAALPPDRWAPLPLRLVPALRILAMRWPMHELWAADAPAAAEWAEERTMLRVWRQEWAVYQTPLDDAEHGALARVRTGCTFGELCEHVAPERPPAEAAELAGALLLRWLEDGVLAADPPSIAN
jgi:hypothetical protein